MNPDFSSIVNALECSYQGNSEQINEAQQFLLNMTSHPTEYSEILINIMINDEIASMTQIAAAIQFKYLLANTEIFDFFTIDMIINLINETTPLVHVQLQTILSRLVKKILSENAEQGFQALLSIVDTCFNSDSKQLFIGIEIIRFIFKLNNYEIMPCLEDYKNNFATNCIVPLFNNTLLNADFESFYPFLFHCMFSTANLLLNYSDLQPLNNWIEIIVNVLDQETEISSEFDKDAVKFAIGIIELKQEIFENQLATLIFNSIVNRIKRNQMSYKGISYSLRYIYKFLEIDSFVEVLLNQNQTNQLLDFVTEVLFEFFVLNSNSIQQINEDLFNFLLFNHNVNPDQMFDTPISGSIFILKKICKKNFFVNEIEQFSLFKITQNLDNDENDDIIYGKLYGAVHFASILAPYVDSAFSENIIQLLASSIEKNQENQQSFYFRMTLLYLFLSNKKIENLELFILALTNLTNESYPTILHYFSAISIPNFFSFFRIEAILSEIESNLNLPIIIKNILELNSNYPTNQITIALEMIFEYFLMFLEPISIDVIPELLSIYNQFAIEENENKSEIISSINKLSNMMKNKEKSIEFYSSSIEINMRIITEIESNCYEDMLSVMYNLIHDSLEGIDQSNLNSLDYLFVQIPEFLFELINNSSDTSVYPLIADILKILSIYFINSSISVDCISQPISKILQNLLNRYGNQNDSELDDMPLFYCLINPINKLSQILFIVLKDEENIQPFFEIFTQINQQCFANSIAAMATLAPLLTFSNELNYRICMNFALPPAFLLCFEFVTQNLSEMPQFIIDDQEKIEQTIKLNLNELEKFIESNKLKKNEMNDENEVAEEESDLDLCFISHNDDDYDSYIFDFQSILDFYQS